MTAKDAIRTNIEMGSVVTGMYLADLSDADLRVRSLPGTNPIAWQLGHLIASEREMIAALGHAMPELPAGFAQAHAKESAGSDEPARFATKDEYLSLLRTMHDATLRALAATPDADLDKPAPEAMRSYAPTVGAVFNVIGQHELLHAGQFVAVRRRLNKPVVM